MKFVNKTNYFKEKKIIILIQGDWKLVWQLTDFLRYVPQTHHEF